MQLSILIRNLNEAPSLEETLLALRNQETDFEYEIVVIDNESEDRSVEIARKMGCKVFSLKREQFSFGYALNYGISLCSGEIILILSAHVLLLNEFFLKKIPGYFKDIKVGGLRFVHALSPEQVRRSFSCGHSQLVYQDNADFLTQNWNNLLVNHCAAIRKSCWEKIPFHEQAFASEDKMWSSEMLKAGYSILYNVPCFYVYVKSITTEIKIKREVIERSAREMITGVEDPLFIQPMAFSLSKKIFAGFKRTWNEMRIQIRVHKGIKSYRGNHRSQFEKKQGNGDTSHTDVCI